MFTLHFDDGTPVCEEKCPVRYNHMRTAREGALTYAVEYDVPVAIHMNGSARLVIRPDGGAEPPQGMVAEDCKRDSDERCFCRNCRAERRRKV